MTAAGVGVAIRVLRVELGMTQHDLDRASGVPHYIISRIERAKTSRAAHYLSAIAEGLGVTPELLTTAGRHMAPSTPISAGTRPRAGLGSATGRTPRGARAQVSPARPRGNTPAPDRCGGGAHTAAGEVHTPADGGEHPGVSFGAGTPSRPGCDITAPAGNPRTAASGGPAAPRLMGGPLLISDHPAGRGAAGLRRARSPHDGRGDWVPPRADGQPQVRGAGPNRGAASGERAAPR